MKLYPVKALESHVSNVNSTVGAVIAQLDKLNVKIAIIIDEQKKIVGTVTDGDLRRGFLKGAKLEDDISILMNKSPHTIRAGQDIKQAVVDLERNIYSHIIEVDNEGRLLNILRKADANVEISTGKRAFIMAGGRGKRLGDITSLTPKPMVEIAGRPMIELIIERLKEYGYSEFYISVHYLKEKIMEYLGNGEKFGVNITYIEEEAPLGTAGSLSLLPHDFNSRILITNSDLVTSIDFLMLEKEHELSGKKATVCVKSYEQTIPFGVLEVNSEHSVTSIIEKPTNLFFISSGMYIFEPSVIKMLKRNEYLDMPDLLGLLIKENQLNSFHVYESWYDVGRVDDLMKVRGVYKDVQG